MLGFLGLASRQKSRQAVRKALHSIGYVDAPLLTNNASTGLALALKEMQAQRPDRSVVVVPAYCCPSVPRVVRELGLKLRAAPVRDNLNLDVERTASLLSRDVLAIVGVHMYALPLDLARLKKLATAAGAYLIDDAAHALGPPFGLGGDAGILSFNQSKTLTGGSPHGGGALFVTCDDLRPGLDRAYATLLEGKSRARAYIWFALRYAIETTPRALTEYVYGLYGPISWALGATHSGAERMSASSALALCAQFKRLHEIRTARTRVVGWYLEIVKKTANLEFVQTQSPRYLSRMLVRWHGGPNASEVRERLAQLGFAARTPYPVWTPHDDPTAAHVAKINATHLELPGSPRLRKEDVEELVAALSACLKSI